MSVECAQFSPSFSMPATRQAQIPARSGGASGNDNEADRREIVVEVHSIKKKDERW